MLDVCHVEVHVEMRFAERNLRIVTMQHHMIESGLWCARGQVHHEHRHGGLGAVRESFECGFGDADSDFVLVARIIYCDICFGAALPPDGFRPDEDVSAVVVRVLRSVSQRSRRVAASYDR